MLSIKFAGPALVSFLLAVAAAGISTTSTALAWSGQIENPGILAGTLETGEYLLLVFSVAIGMLADMSTLAESGLQILLFCTGAKLGALILHLLFARLFRIDRDTYLITSTSAMYGPVFVPQVASVLKNKELLFAGMATGLLGYAIGNYFGLGIAGLVIGLFG